MKKSLCIYALIALTTTRILTGCSSSEEKMNDAQANVNAASIELDRAEKVFDEQTDKFKLESEEKIAANERSISRLKENTRNLNEKAQADYQTELTRLEEKNTTLRKRILGSKKEDHEKWEAFKREFSHDMDELGQAIKDLTKNNVN
ncbi:MAG: hypothetical protein ACJ77K_02215 [Bacteroidia bacterium]